MWLEELKRAEGEGYAGDSGAGMGEGGGVSIILVGNKKDLVSTGGDGDGGAVEGAGEQQGGATSEEGEGRRKREVTYEEARAWADRHGINHFVETSAKSGEGVEEAFVTVAKEIYERVKAGRVVVGGKSSGVKGPPGKAGKEGMGIVGVGGGGSRGAMGGCC